MKTITFEIPDELEIMTFTFLGLSDTNICEVVVSAIKTNDVTAVKVNDKNHKYHVELGGKSE